MQKNVKNIFSGDDYKEPANKSPPLPDIVMVLENMLKSAKSGRLRTLAYLAVLDDPLVFTDIMGDHNEEISMHIYGALNLLVDDYREEYLVPIYYDVEE